jgi:hypothetical protein
MNTHFPKYWQLLSADDQSNDLALQQMLSAATHKVRSQNGFRLFSDV